MADNMSKNADEIVSYLKDNGFSIFYASDLFGEDGTLPEVVWDERVDYKKFFDIAKKEGIKNIIYYSEYFTDDQFEKINHILNDKKNISIEEWIEIRRERTKHGENMGAYSFAYIKDHVLYCLKDQIQWNKELEKRVLPRSVSIQQNRMIEENNREDNLKKMEEIPIEKIGDEFIKMLTKEFPNATTRDVYAIDHAFWEMKGVDRYGKGSILREKVKQYVNKKIIDDEKKMLITLIEDCISWAKENKMKKVFKYNISEYLNEKNVKLSWESSDMLYSTVNRRLKKDTP